MKKSFIFKAMMLIALMCVPFALTSCEEEVVSEANVYRMGFEKESGNFFEMAAIQGLYMEELASLGINSTKFTMDGEVSECDSKIKAACLRAEEKLNTIVIEGTYIWRVTRGSKSTVIYRKAIN